MKIILFLSISMLLNFTSIAQNTSRNNGSNVEKTNDFSEMMCPLILANETGIILSGKTVTVEKKMTTATSIISVTKAEGNARATVSIYVDDIFVDRLVFHAEDKKIVLTKDLSEVKNKTIRIEIMNQSKAGFFKYAANIKSESTSLLDKGNNVIGRLLGQTKKTITSAASCSNKASVIIKRTDGKARASVKIWKEKDDGWELLDTKTFETLQPNNTLILSYNTSKPLKIEIKNISINEKFNYKIDVIAVK